VKCHGGRDHYRASEAEQSTWDRAHRPKRCKLADNPFLCRAVSAKLRCEWAPQQIAGWLKRTYPGDDSKHVSHETIYRSLFIQARGVLKKRVASVSENTTHDTPIPARHIKEQRTGSNQEHGIDSTTPC
jgi:IS30 family transposase